MGEWAHPLCPTLQGRLSAAAKLPRPPRVDWRYAATPLAHPRAGPEFPESTTLAPCGDITLRLKCPAADSPRVQRLCAISATLRGMMGRPESAAATVFVRPRVRARAPARVGCHAARSLA